MGDLRHLPKRLEYPEPLELPKVRPCGRVGHLERVLHLRDADHRILEESIDNRGEPNASAFEPLVEAAAFVPTPTCPRPHEVTGD